MNSDRLYQLGTIAGLAALATLAVGLYLGLVWAPPDALMGDAQRIMYVHFPSWIATALGYLTAFVASLLYLIRRHPRYDAWAVAGAEVGLLFNCTGLVTGSIWGRPTWGVWWTWDPRLTSTAVMLITFAGYLVLRAFIDDPDRRARASALVATLGFLNVPIVYFSVRWWRTLHQPQSSPETVDHDMVIALRTMMVAFALLYGFLATRRAALARIEDTLDRADDELEDDSG